MTFVKTTINDENYFLVRFLWSENILEISILDYKNLKIWKGTISKESMVKIAKKLYSSTNDIIQEYKTELGKALELSSTGIYTCTLEMNSFSITKKDSEYTSTTILEKTLLKEIALDAGLPDILSTIAVSMSTFHSEIHEKDETIRRLTKERDELRERCISYSNIVNDKTPHLMAQFAIAFNSLKAKVDDQMENSSTATPSHENGAIRKKRGRPVDDSDDSDSYGEDTDIDTDDERRNND